MKLFQIGGTGKNILSPLFSAYRKHMKFTAKRRQAKWARFYEDSGLQANIHVEALNRDENIILAFSIHQTVVNVVFTVVYQLGMMVMVI